jgi:hypothetical protein
MSLHLRLFASAPGFPGSKAVSPSPSTVGKGRLGRLTTDPFGTLAGLLWVEPCGSGQATQLPLRRGHAIFEPTHYPAGKPTRYPAGPPHRIKPAW